VINGTRIRAETKNALVTAVTAVVAKKPASLIYVLAREAYDLVVADSIHLRHPSPEFDGEVYDPALDKERLNKQIGRVFEAMRQGDWLTLEEISGKTGDPPASVSAQLRHLRKHKFGAYLVAKRARGDRELGLFEYRLLAPDGTLITFAGERSVTMGEER